MPDPKAMEAAVHAYVAAFDAGAAEQVVALFAADATVEDPIGTPPHVGADAIYEFYRSAMQTGAKLELQGPIRIAGNYAAFAFKVLLHMEGRNMHVDVIDTFKFNDDNKVVEMRAYFGPSNMHGFS